MSKDLTAALEALMKQPANTNTVPALVARGTAPAVKASSPLTGGGAGGNGGLALGGERIITSSDGLFTFTYPDTLIAVINGVQVTIGVASKP